MVLVYLAVQPETKLLPVPLPMPRPSVIFSKLLTILSFPPPPPVPCAARWFLPSALPAEGSFNGSLPVRLLSVSWCDGDN